MYNEIIRNIITTIIILLTVNNVMGNTWIVKCKQQPKKSYTEIYIKKCKVNVARFYSAYKLYIINIFSTAVLLLLCYCQGQDVCTYVCVYHPLELSRCMHMLHHKFIMFLCFTQHNPPLFYRFSLELHIQCDSHTACTHVTCFLPTNTFKKKNKI